ncbi:hypothetical protein CONPUDRAFT_158322 [Coniophora puteana RWD-64-598 SS2]|uniref:Virilizer N-terminal domain-containing protein n=1 Tax=Coniophora puteana (strain RWD-64-598) TaxID=741705 RepID=A0A5M3MCC7_CONPW|nr:uncharacterized protein CONPUDRAFT_158322 [Coniophora puteana RWD-64-598 SS2]EIW76295.1 hypothetical protein CONPUDRAFT_158322 [Coniophora puteana RWD-64-598 SS2]
MLLQWCTLEASGPSGLAAVRFSAPCRVQSIRIYPSGAKPFAQNQDVVATTSPEAFFLDVYFNAHPVQPPPTQADPKQKQKAPPNALVPTTIPYAGGEAEFIVNMSNFATRLMIVRGSFETVSMAIYGNLVIDDALQLPPQSAASSSTIFPTKPIPLAAALDPANADDPTALARALLQLIPGSPSLELAIRLMFCLKPSNDDWDLPEFPYLYTDLCEEDISVELDTAFKSLSKPVAPDTSAEAFQRFAEKIRDPAGPRDDMAYVIAGILNRAAPQTSVFAEALMEALDIEDIFDADSLDEDTLLRLLSAAANPVIAKGLRTEPFLNVLKKVHSSPTIERETKAAARKLETRIRAWRVCEGALSGADGDGDGAGPDYAAAAGFMKEIAVDEQSFGAWIEYMVTSPGFSAKREGLHDVDAAGADRSNGTSGPPVLWDEGVCSEITHSEFMAFVRAYVGVACVLAVYAWSDSLPNDSCRERTLGVLRLWQQTPGYREILNHFLLLRQMSFRLECMTSDNDPPTRAGIHAEHILLALAEDPRAFLRGDFLKCVFGLRQPLSCITEEQRLELQRLAEIVEDGLDGAVFEIADAAAHPQELAGGGWGEDEGQSQQQGQGLGAKQRIRQLRVAGAVVREVFETLLPDESVLELRVWQDNAYGLVHHVVDVLGHIAAQLKARMFSAPGSRRAEDADAGTVDQLAHLAIDMLRLIEHLDPVSQTVTTRTVRQLVVAIADISSCAADAAASAELGGVHTVLRGTCERVVRVLSRPPWEGGSTSANAARSAVILQTLLQAGLRIDVDAGAAADPVRRLQSVYALVNQALPLPPSSPPAGPSASLALKGITSPFAPPEDDLVYGDEDSHGGFFFLHAHDDPEQRLATWLLKLVPPVLALLLRFLRALPVCDKPVFFVRLAALDRWGAGGALALGEYVLEEEARRLRETVGMLEEGEGEGGFARTRVGERGVGVRVGEGAGPGVQDELYRVMQYEANVLFRFFRDVLVGQAGAEVRTGAEAEAEVKMEIKEEVLDDAAVSVGDEDEDHHDDTRANASEEDHKTKRETGPDTSASEEDEWIQAACTNEELGRLLGESMLAFLEVRLFSAHQGVLASRLSRAPSLAHASRALQLGVAATCLRGVQLFEEIKADGVSRTPWADAARVVSMLDGHGGVEDATEEVRREVGPALACAAVTVAKGLDVEVHGVVSILEWFVSTGEKGGKGKVMLSGLTQPAWTALLAVLEAKLSTPERASLSSAKARLTVPSPNQHPQPPSIPTTFLSSASSEADLALTPDALIRLLTPLSSFSSSSSHPTGTSHAPHAHPHSRPSTPPPRKTRSSPGKDVLGLATLSPPTAVLRSPAAALSYAGLTKTYTRNDFRALRQLPSARQNTSRLPSMHVDDFEQSASVAGSSPVLQPQPVGGVSVSPEGPSGYGILGPPFNMPQ